MRWLTFLLLAGLFLIAQTVLAPRAELFGSRGDWLLVFVVFVALNAPPFHAAAGCWLIGALADLSTIERPGMMALGYMGAALFVASIRDYLFRDSIATRVIVTGITCAALRLLFVGYTQMATGWSLGLLDVVLRHVVLDSLITALWAAPIHYGLGTLSRSMGLGMPRYAYTSH